MEIRCSILNSSKTMILAMPRTWLVRNRGKSIYSFVKFRKNKISSSEDETDFETVEKRD